MFNVAAGVYRSAGKERRRVQNVKDQVVQQPMKKAYQTPTLQTHGPVQQVTEKHHDFSGLPFPSNPGR
jgi:hypothetical protein